MFKLELDNLNEKGTVPKFTEDRVVTRPEGNY